jgi:hypothetical protein
MKNDLPTNVKISSTKLGDVIRKFITGASGPVYSFQDAAVHAILTSTPEEQAKLSSAISERNPNPYSEIVAKVHIAQLASTQAAHASGLAQVGGRVEEARVGAAQAQALATRAQESAQLVNARVDRVIQEVAPAVNGLVGATSQLMGFAGGVLANSAARALPPIAGDIPLPQLPGALPPNGRT